MKYKLNVKLILSYLFIALFLVGLIAIVTNITFEKEFKKYVMNIQKDKNTNVVTSLENSYKDLNGEWNNVNFEEIGTKGLENGLIIKIIDNEGNTLWDAMEHDSGMCAQMLAEMAHNMKKYYPAFDGKYTAEEYVLNVGDEKIGNVSIGYYGPYYFSENDIAFLKTFNTVLLITASIAIILSICIGAYISKKITKNITNVIKTTREIASGNYKNRIIEKSDTKEIIDLIESVNNLALTLNKQEQLRKDLTSDIAHELRTPITTLESHLEAIKDGVWQLTPDRIEDLYEEIIRLSKIVNDLDKLTQYDNNNIVLNKSEFDIKRLLSKIVTNFDIESKEKKIVVKVEGNNQKVVADKDRIKQVFINLISNSLKYTNKCGNISIIISEANGKVKVTIKDDGIGIASDDLPYIFERFYRADKSRTRATGGSGIGLSIVKNIVDAHNGTVTADSKLNKGTSVTVMLPR